MSGSPAIKSWWCGLPATKAETSCAYSMGRFSYVVISIFETTTLYDKTVPAINMHIRNILTDEELTEKSTIKEYLIVQSEGTRTVSRKTNLYNLDMILAIGYRVRSSVGNQFRNQT